MKMLIFSLLMTILGSVTALCAENSVSLNDLTATQRFIGQARIQYISLKPETDQRISMDINCPSITVLAEAVISLKENSANENVNRVVRLAKNTARLDLASCQGSHWFPRLKGPGEIFDDSNSILLPTIDLVSEETTLSLHVQAGNLLADKRDETVNLKANTILKALSN